MAAVLRSSPSHLPPSSLPCNREDGLEVGSKEKRKREEEQLSLLALLLAVVRKSLARCRTEDGGGGAGAGEGFRSMEIGWPTNVRHVAHVTFDRFHGFLGLPVEFEPEVPRRVPSASANIFGVSTESMQCSYDSRENSVPTILLLMQSRLYEQGGLRAEGIFRINAENSQEEYVRDQLNNGVVPDGIDVHCLAGLIKAWFRELPTGILDSLAPEQVMQCKTEEECARLVKLLPQSEAALLDWAVNLMADVVQDEQHNKMNARNIAMVFAPNMTQMADPLIALMYAVQVMNFLKMLIEKALKERKETVLEDASVLRQSPSGGDDHRHPPLLKLETCVEEEEDEGQVFVAQDAATMENPASPRGEDLTVGDMVANPRNSCEDTTLLQDLSHSDSCQTPGSVVGGGNSETAPKNFRMISRKKNPGQSSGARQKKGQSREGHGQAVQATASSEKTRGITAVSRINLWAERAEAWR